ncbi:MAG TPA: hypothetical protein VF040_19760 [Ktedonobacterales bacterium]
MLEKYWARYLERLERGGQQMTRPAWRYLHEDARLTTFLRLVLRIANDSAEAHHDDVQVIAQKLKDGADIPPNTLSSVLRAANTIFEISSYGDLVAQMELTRMVDNFLSYLSELLTLIFRTKPETLRTDETTVSLSYILKYETMDELVGALAESRVNELAYKGLRELSKYLSRRIGFDLYTSEEDMAAAVKLIEQRNLIVHNRGIINHIFVSKLPEYDGMLGQPIPLSVRQVTINMVFLRASALDIDQRATEKFGLPVTTPAEAMLPKSRGDEWWADGEDG